MKENDFSSQLPRGNFFPFWDDKKSRAQLPPGKRTSISLARREKLGGTLGPGREDQPVNCVNFLWPLRSKDEFL